MASSTPLPPFTPRLLAFQACNALSFTVGMGTPLLLVASHIGADKGQMGLMISLTSLLATLQLLATGACERLGYKRVLMAGWSMRAFFLLAIVPLPLLAGRVPSGVLVWSLVAAILGFNAIRGYAAGSWFPWLNQLIPAHQRGHYFGYDQLVFNAASLVALVASGLFLGESPMAWQYSVLYVASFCIGVSGVFFLRPVPCDMTRPATMPVPTNEGAARIWEGVRHAWAHPPYRYTTVYIALQGLALSAPPGFLSLFLLEEWGYSDRTVLLLSATQTCGVLLTCVSWGRLSDRVGSRPLMRLADIGVMSTFAFWAACAAGWIKVGPWAAGGVFLLTGILLAAHATASTRLMLGVLPPREITIAAAFFQVWSAVTRGLAPIVWGLVLVRFQPEPGLAPPPMAGAADMLAHPYALLFAASLLILFIAQFLMSRIHEASALRTPRLVIQMFWEFTGRVVSGFVSVTK